MARVGALAHIVCESTAGVSNGGGQARHGTRWDLANELADGLRLDESCQDGDEGSFGELHSYRGYGVSVITSVKWTLVVELMRYGTGTRYYIDGGISKEIAGERTQGVL